MVLATHRWPRFEHKLQMDSIIIIVDCPSHTVSPTSPPPASLAHSLISARDMHLATRMLYCLCHFATRWESIWPPWLVLACSTMVNHACFWILLDLLSVCLSLVLLAIKDPAHHTLWLSTHTCPVHCCSILLLPPTPHSLVLVDH